MNCLLEHKKARKFFKTRCIYKGKTGEIVRTECIRPRKSRPTCEQLLCAPLQDRGRGRESVGIVLYSVTHFN